MQSLPVVCQPAVVVPDHVVTMDQTLALTERLHQDHPRLPLVLRLIANTGVRTRHLVLPLAEVLRHPGVEARAALHQQAARRLLPPVIEQALGNAGLTAADIDAIIYVSCTSFAMPSMTAWLINNLGFRPDTRQLPIAQLGCAAGGAAVNRAYDLCLARPGSNVLIVSCEFCSLCYQPGDADIGSLLSDGLFGDAVAAAVVTGQDRAGFRAERSSSYLIPGTEDWICFAVKPTGFHFRLDRRVPRTMEQLAPVLREVSAAHGWDAGLLDFYIVHAGGPRILDDLSKFLGVSPDAFRHSRATLTEYGNIASAVVLDALRRLFLAGAPRPGATGLLAGFGPGITAEMAVGSWSGGAGVAARDAGPEHVPFSRTYPRLTRARIFRPDISWGLVMLGRDHALSGAVAFAAIGPLLHVTGTHLLAGVALTAGAGVLPDLDEPGSTIARSFGFLTGAFAWIVHKLSGGHRKGTHSLLGIAVLTAGAYAAGWWQAGVPHGTFSWHLVPAGLVLGLLFSSGFRALRVGGHFGDALGLALAAFVLWQHWDLDLVTLAGRQVAVLGVCTAIGMLAHVAGDMCTHDGCPLLYPLSRHEFGLLPEPIRITTNKLAEHWVVTPLLLAALAWLAWRDTPLT